MLKKRGIGYGRNNYRIFLRLGKLGNRSRVRLANSEYFSSSHHIEVESIIASLIDVESQT